MKWYLNLTFCDFMDSNLKSKERLWKLMMNIFIYLGPIKRLQIKSFSEQSNCWWRPLWRRSKRCSRVEPNFECDVPKVRRLDLLPNKTQHLTKEQLEEEFIGSTQRVEIERSERTDIKEISIVSLLSRDTGSFGSRRRPSQEKMGKQRYQRGLSIGDSTQ